MSQLDTSTKSSFVVDTLTSYIRKALNDALHASAHKYNSTCDISTIILEYPANSEHGDFSSNCALMYAKKIGIAPKVLAEEIIAHEGCVELTTKYGIHIQVAGHGFINFHIPEDFIYKAIAEILDKGSAGNFGKRNFDAKKKILIEYTDPNPFKVFHIGHLMANALGESLSRLLEYSGAHIIRANYQGDVGLHVAKALWAMRNEIGASGQQYGGFPNITHESAHWIGEMYVKGSGAYDNDEEINGKKARAEIAEINKKIFDRSDESINTLYDWGRKVTLEAFEEIYKLVGTKFDHYYFESEVSRLGIELVEKHTPQVFEKSEGAIIFPGEKYGLHTRVFITSLGLPAYEAKELGLTYTKFKDYNPDISIVVTANEQDDYFKVVRKALSLMNPDYALRTRHISHGMLRFASGKMSSRKGNVITGESLLEDSRYMVFEKMSDRNLSESEKQNVADIVGVGAIKFSILKQAAGSDVIYNQEQAVSFEGDSGPYLQYSCVRAQAVLKKAEEAGLSSDSTKVSPQRKITELEKLLVRFPTIVDRAREELEPHHIATYLINLAGAFNALYGQEAIVSDKDDAPYKIALTQAFVYIMKSGLYILGMKVPEKM